jgi:hypothetical protein
VDSLLLPTILPDLNGDGKAAQRFIESDVTDPFTGLTSRGLYIEDSVVNAAGFKVSSYNLIAIGNF